MAVREGTEKARRTCAGLLQQTMFLVNWKAGVVVMMVLPLLTAGCVGRHHDLEEI
jgi:hypothetical protein